MENNSKTLIVYFSASGNTKLVAEIMRDECSADIARLIPKKEMNVSGAGYLGWGVRQLISKSERETEPIAFNVRDFDRIIIGTPVWTYTVTPPVRYFMKENDFTGKKVGVFCCHGGQMSNTLDDMVSLMPGCKLVGKIDFKNASTIDKDLLKLEIQKWIESL